MIRCWLNYAAAAVLAIGVPVVYAAEDEGNTKIISLPEGIHDMPGMVLSGGHVLVEGKGRGVTILRLPDGIKVNGPEPIIRNLTLVGDGKGAGILFEDTWSGTIENVEIENYSEGIRIELTNRGREKAGGATLNGWPGAAHPVEFWGSRVTLTSIRDVEITGPGDGVVLVNRLKDSSKGNYYSPTQDRRPGEFFTATTIWGGHIYVKGRGVVIGDGVATTKLIGTYIDIGPGGGIEMEYGARNLSLVGVSLDMSPHAKKVGASKLKISKRSIKGFKSFATDLEKSDMKVTKP